MHTQNVNVAASESPKTWVETPESVYFSQKVAALIDLAKIEGDMLFFRTLARLGIEPDDADEEYDAPWIARDRIERLEEMGAVSSPVVYEMVRDVDAMIKATDSELSRGEWPTLKEMQASAADIKADVMESLRPFRFSVDVLGQMEYPEDDPVYGTYWQDGCIQLGRAWTVGEAMNIAAAVWLEDEWDPREQGECYWDSDFGRDMGPVSFSPRLIVIRDAQNRKVLTADAAGLKWNSHVTSEKEISRIAAEKEALLREAAQESGWDNFETARQLRAKAEATQAGIVDAAWQAHPDVMAALAAFARPERRTWGNRLNTRGLSKSMADDMTFLVSLSDRSCPASKNERYELVHGLALALLQS